MASTGARAHARTTGLIAKLSLALLVAAGLQPTSLASAAEDPAPSLGGQLYATGGEVSIEVMPATAGLTSTLFLLEPEEVSIATNREVGKLVTVGPYEAGAELVFGIRVQGQEYRMGPGTRNPDGIEHAVVDFRPDGCAVVGFEDLYGGGDRDYDDNKFTFCGGIAAEPEDPEDPPAPDPVQPPKADAGTDQSVPEGSMVTLDGSGSRASTQPALTPSEAQGVLPGGTSLGVEVLGLDPEAPTPTAQGRVEIGQGPPVQNTSLAYAVDVSGSTGDAANCGGDANNDGRVNRVLDCEIAAAIKLHEKIVEAGTVDKVAVIAFSSSASARDLDPTSGTATLVAPDADKDADGILDVVEALRALRAGGGTNFVPPARTACNLLATTGSPNLMSAFLSDGSGGGALATVLPCDPPVVFKAFAAGAGSSCNAGPVGARLNDLAQLSGGTCVNVPDVSNLPDILPEVISSRIVKVAYTLDGGDPVDLSDSLALPAQGPASIDLDIPLPADLAGSHELCVVVTGSDAGGESSETTCSEVVTVTGELTYDWRLVESDGPQVFLSSVKSASPTFVAPDDGTYVFELTIGDGTGGTATDRVTVTVTNVDPVLAIEPGAAYAGGVTQITGTLTDEGWQDTHSVRFDWGDGTVDEVEVTTRGAGWGTFFGSHVYRTAGSYDATVTLLDDDGGRDAADLSGFEVATPIAVWANSTSATGSLDWAGGAGNIRGRVHTNGRLRFVGASKVVVGPATYAGSLSADTTRNSFTPEPTPAAVQPYPFAPDIAAFRPDGEVADEVGSAYQDMSSRCVDGAWHEVQTPLASGVYYADCDIRLNGSDIGGRVTLVSEGHIKIAGSRPAFEPYLDGLLLLAGAEGDKAIDIAASSSKFLGTVFAGQGQISISGGSNRFYCGILGDEVTITGTDVDVRGADCGRPDATVAGPVVVPDLKAELTVDRADALPSDRLGYAVKVTNSGTTLVVPALIGLENVDATTATLGGYSFAIERRDAATGAWTPLATKGDEGLRIDLRPNAFPGVGYPTEGGVAGTTLAPGAWATWGLQAVLDLDPAQATRLFDPAQTTGVRTRVDFDVTPSTAQARRLYTIGDDFVTVLRELTPDVTAATSTVVLPSGEAVARTEADEPGLARLSPGGSVTLNDAWDVPVLTPRTATETDAGYLSRLLAADGTQLNAASFVLASGGVGRLVAPLTRVTTRRHLPVLGISTTGPETVQAGSTADYTVRLANLGSGDASAVSAAARAGSEDLSLTAAPTELARGERVDLAASYTAPADESGPVVLRGETTWADARGNAYGVNGSSLDVARQTPAELGATLTDALQVDADGNGSVGPGDTVRYTLTVRNGGGVPLTGVAATVPVDANSALVAGSGTTPNGGSIVLADGTAEVTLPDIAGNGSRTARFDVTVADPFPAGVARLQVQGEARAAGMAAVPTDDPALPGAADPTRTSVTVPRPALATFLTGRLAVDADGTGTVTPGDTLDFRLEVSSVGTQEVTGIEAVVPTPQGTSLVAGSVTTTQGTVTPGDVATARLGTLAPFQAATVTFRLTVDKPLADGITAIGVQAETSSGQLPTHLSDDPGTAEVGDPTVLPVGQAPGQPDRTGPVIATVEPASGTVITTPVHVTTTLTAPDGLTLDSWVVDYRRVDDTNATVLASGSGGAVDAVLDPTKLPNGTYVVTVRGSTTIGGVNTSEITVVVDGDLKLGRYTTTYSDLTVDAAGLPIDVQRTYDSFDKTTGDFGVGWSLDLADFQVSSNGPLGAGGWTMQGCGSGLIFVPLCFTSSHPHFVTVTWPDGHNEFFDLTPAQGSTFFPGLTTAAFTARPGSTSKLQALDTSLFFANGDLNGGAFGSDGPYDPGRFLLTDRFGTKYTLVAGGGLERIEDRSGNVVTIDEAGIHSSNGPSVLFERDAFGRIARVTDPAGKDIVYGYDAAGDLVSVTDRDGRVLEMTYLADHYLVSASPDGQRPLRTLNYSDDGRLESVTDGEGNTVTVDVDPNARVETTTGPDPALTTVRTFDTDGNVTQIDRVFEGRTLTSRFVYNDMGLPEVSTDPLGHTSEATYDAKGNVTRLVDRDGVVTALTYNGFGQPLTYRVGGALKQQFGYDAAGNLERVDHGPDAFSEFTYDTVGRILSARDVGGRTQRYTYGPDGFPSTIEGPEGTTELTYDALGKLTSVTDPLSGTTSYGFDETGRITSLTNARNRTWSYAYDEFGRLESETDPLGRATTYTYDAAGRLRTSADRNAVVTTLDYGRDGQVTRRSSTDGSFTAYDYDAAGRLESTDNGTARLSFTWDDASRPVTETLTGAPGTGIPSVTLHRGWTAADQLAWIEDSEGRTSYDYDGEGRLTGVEDSVGGGFGLGYDALDRLTSLSRPNGVTTTWGYEGDRLASQVTRHGETELHSVLVERDESGFPRQVTDASGVHTYAHDPAGRLTSADHPDGSGIPDESYAYDDAGNRTAWVGNPADQVSHDAANRLRSDGRWLYTYDDEGRLVSRVDRTTGAETTFRWNATGDLLGVDRPGGADAVSYRYDPLGRRIETAVGADVSRTVFGGDNPLLRLDGTNDVQSRFVHGLGPDGMLARTGPGAATYPVGDAAGTVHAMTDAAGSVTERFAYDSFGNVAEGSEAGSPHGFHGFEQDPLGMYDARARAYDPTTGRFISEDPVPAENLYQYALNSPLAANDPSGMVAMVEYGATTQNSARSSLAFCTQGSWTASLFMDVAVEVSLAAAMGPIAGQGGLYAFWDAKANKPYVGRSVDLLRRLNEHLAAGRIDTSKGIRLLTGLADDVLPAAEQLAMNSCGRAGRGAASTLANKINAINKSRRDELARLKTTLNGLLGW